MSKLTDGSTFKRSERSHTGYGNKKQILGPESHLPFGYCCLSLQPIQDCVVSPSGHLYERESIIEYLLHKISDLKEQKLKYEKQQKDLEIVALRKELEQEQERVDSFIAMHNNITLSDRVVEEENKREIKREIREGGGKEIENGHQQKPDKSEKEKSSRKRICAEEKDSQSKEKSDSTEEERVNHESKKLKLSSSSSSSPSLPHMTKKHDYNNKNSHNNVGKISISTSISTSQKIKPPLKRPPSPMTKRPLRVKDLISVKLPLDPEKSRQTYAGGRYICQLTKEEITHRPVVLIVKTGTVLLESAYMEIVKKDMICPISGIAFEEKDVLQLVSGGTGFAAKGRVEVEVEREFNNMN